MFGNWVYRRRKLLDLTQEDLARKVNCSLSMLRKIEREERRPSQQLAELLADQLGIDASQRISFLRMARGYYFQEMDPPLQEQDTQATALAAPGEQDAERAPFVARDRQLHLLHEQLEQALQGHSRVVFIVGEAGQGKTSLMTEFALQAMDARPDLILAGGSSDIFTGQGDPLLPFRDIFRMLAGDFENASFPGVVHPRLIERLRAVVPGLIEILLKHGTHLIDTIIPGDPLESYLVHKVPNHLKNPDLLLRLHSQRTRRAAPEDQVIHQDRLFSEISTTLNILAQQHPLMLLLDDLHWIDPSSAALLGHLTMRLKGSPVLILGSYRPEDLTQRQPGNESEGRTRHPLQEVLSESLRQIGNNRIDLDHFKPGEELEFVDALLDLRSNAFSTAFRKQLAHVTEGHPLFTVELLREMQERGDIIQGYDGCWVEGEYLNWENIPARVEGVIEKRVTCLPDDLFQILTAASVQGETFYAEVIAQVKQTDPVKLIQQIGAQLDRQHRLVREQGIKHVGSQRLSQYRFQHHLFQKYLYGNLGSAERMYLHEAVGNALQNIYESASNPDEVPAAQLARHFQESHQGLKASRYCLLAGNQAARVLAFDEAILSFECGITELAQITPSSETAPLTFELQLGLARALWHNGKVIEAVNACEKTIEIARKLPDTRALARAVLAYEEPRWRLNLRSDLSQQFMREAIAILGEEPSGLRVRLLVGLARSLLDTSDQTELRDTVEQALFVARQIDDPLALCDGLRIKAQIDRRPEAMKSRLVAIQELIATAESIHDQERLADGLDLYVYDMLEQGQIDLVTQVIDAQRKVAYKIKQPFQMHIAAVFQTMLAILQGEFERAEALAKEAAELSEQIGLADLDGILGIHMFTIRREQGRLAEIAPFMKLVAANNPQTSTWRPGLALIYKHLGLQEECQAIFESLASAGFASLPQDSLWVATLAYLSEVCAFLQDSERAATLYGYLLPYEGLTVVVGGATVCYGAAARFLGMLAVTMSDYEAAERHFRSAIELDARLRAWPWLAHSQYEYAAMLLKTGAKENLQRAYALLDECACGAQRMGMAYLASKVVELKTCYEILPDLVGKL